MVLIDTIDQWDCDSIQCSAHSHLYESNPLRDRGRLSVFTGVEYAAQAMAAHARLSQPSGEPPGKGFLAVASRLKASVDTLDHYRAPLRITARALAQNTGSSMYQFRLESEGHCLLEGQLTAVVEPSVPGN